MVFDHAIPRALRLCYYTTCGSVIYLQDSGYILCITYRKDRTISDTTSPYDGGEIYKFGVEPKIHIFRHICPYSLNEKERKNDKQDNEEKHGDLTQINVF